MTLPNLTIPFLRPKTSMDYALLTNNYVQMALVDVEKLDTINALWSRAPDLGMDGFVEEYLFYFIAERIMCNGIEIDKANFAKHHIELSKEDITESERSTKSLMYTGDKSIHVNTDNNGRCHYRIETIKTATYRMVYSNPSLGGVPRKYRDIFKAKSGYSFVKTDANALHPRILANYLLNAGHDALAKDIDSGDFHTSNIKRFNVETRDEAKKKFYQLLYSNDNTLVNALPGLSELVNSLNMVLSKRDYVRGIDDRVIYVPDKNVALCFLIQSAEAILMKRLMIEIDSICVNHKLDFSAVKADYDYEFALVNHDEIVIEVKDCFSDLMKTIVEEAYRRTTNYYYFNVPITGDIKTVKHL